MANNVCFVAVVVSVLSCVDAEGRLSDLVARFKANEETTTGPWGLDSLLDGHDAEREATHSKSWNRLDGRHHRRNSLTALLDEFYPAGGQDTGGHTTQAPFGHRHPHRPSDGRPDRESDLRTTPGPLAELEQGPRSGEGNKWAEEPTVPTRHHHRYHRADGLSPHQPQADSTFSHPSVSGYYDYSASNSNGSPTVKNSMPSSTEWRKTAKKSDKSRWSSPSSKSVGQGPRGEMSESELNHLKVVSHVKTSNEMACRFPQPKIIRVSDHYPSAAKHYFPSCTRLHQCAQDTGCCPPTKRCGPKSTQRVELYFYSTFMRHSGDDAKNFNIEKLPFYNHTECECQDRSDEMPRDNDRISSNSVDSIYNLETNGRQVCLCPSEFTLKFLPNGACACDCFDKQKECTKYKRGKEFFNHKDKLCIAMNKCVVPLCDYGTYSRRYGRCPKKHERHKGSWSRLN